MVMTSKMQKIIADAQPMGWILEPRAKELLTECRLGIPKGIVTDSPDTAQKFLAACAGPVVIKAVSADIVHKTEHQAVVTGIQDADTLAQHMERLLSLKGCSQVLVEEMVSGIEILVGAKNDTQFGPVVVLGPGGTGVELYNDTAIRMAPVKPTDVYSMVDSLGAKPVFHGFRGQAGVNMEALVHLLVTFSGLIMDLEPFFESIDLNPVICTPDHCVVADARIMLF
ncbi:MAG: acetate--CoA ligase family protein [Desulfotignum sp.]